MKRYFSVIVAVMLSVISFSLTSCSDDDDNPESSTSFTVNGVKLDNSFGAATEEPGNGKCLLLYTVMVDGDAYPSRILFHCSTSSFKAGDDFASKIVSMDGLEDGDMTYTVKSGKAIVKSVERNYMTVDFQQLEMYCSDFVPNDWWVLVPALNKATLTLNGTATLDI